MVQYHIRIVRGRVQYQPGEPVRASQADIVRAQALFWVLSVFTLYNHDIAKYREKLLRLSTSLFLQQTET